MAKGFCSSCGKEVGTFMRPSGRQCTRCLKIFCDECSREIGLIFKKRACPHCGVLLVDNVRKTTSKKELDRLKREGLL